MELKIDKETFFLIVSEGLRQVMPKLVYGRRITMIEGPSKYGSRDLVELEFEDSPKSQALIGTMQTPPTTAFGGQNYAKD